MIIIKSLIYIFAFYMRVNAWFLKAPIYSILSTNLYLQYYRYVPRVNSIQNFNRFTLDSLSQYIRNLHISPASNVWRGIIPETNLVFSYLYILFIPDLLLGSFIPLQFTYYQGITANAKDSEVRYKKVYGFWFNHLKNWNMSH